MNRYRVGIIGCGWFAQFYFKALPALKNRMKLEWIADPEEERTRAVAHDLGVRSLKNYRDGLKDVDAVFILVPHHLHYEIAMDCLNSGCHVLIEKPLTISLADADEIIATSERLGRTLMVAYPHRYRKSMQQFKGLVTGGEYGRLIMLDGCMDESLQGYSLGWISKKATLGGGVFFSSSPHMLDVMLWIAGDPASISMVGTKGGLEMEGEDTACSVIKFKNGVIGVTQHTWVSPKSQIWYTMHALCEKAHITITTTPVGDLFREGAECQWQTRIVMMKDQEEILLDSGEGLDLVPEIQHFFDCIDHGKIPETSGPKARQMISLIRGAYEKAEREGANV